VDAVLLFDGACLHRPALDASRDIRIFVAADFAEVLRRELERDLHAFGSADEVEWRSNGRERRPRQRRCCGCLVDPQPG
jgi:hypothetical protein